MPWMGCTGSQRESWVLSPESNTRFPAMSSLSFQAWTHAITSWCVSLLLLPVSAFSCARRLPWLSAILKSTKILLVMALDLLLPTNLRPAPSAPAKLAMSKCQWYMLYAPIRRPLRSQKDLGGRTSGRVGENAVFLGAQQNIAVNKSPTGEISARSHNNIIAGHIFYPFSNFSCCFYLALVVFLQFSHCLFSSS